MISEIRARIASTIPKYESKMIATNSNYASFDNIKKSKWVKFWASDAKPKLIKITKGPIVLQAQFLGYFRHFNAPHN